MHLRHEIVGHLGQEIVEGVRVDLSNDDLVINQANLDWLFTATFDKESHLVLFGDDVCAEKGWRVVIARIDVTVVT